jgi:hypothetical protein
MQEAEGEIDYRHPSCDGIKDDDPERGRQTDEIVHGVISPAIVGEKYPFEFLRIIKQPADANWPPPFHSTVAPHHARAWWVWSPGPQPSCRFCFIQHVGFASSRSIACWNSGSLSARAVAPRASVDADQQPRPLSGYNRAWTSGRNTTPADDDMRFAKS